jgi:hypothetical protein
VFINYSGSNKKWIDIYNKTVQKYQVNNISGTPELDINYSMGGGEGGPLQEIFFS